MVFLRALIYLPTPATFAFLLWKSFLYASSFGWVFLFSILFGLSVWVAVRCRKCEREFGLGLRDRDRVFALFVLVGFCLALKFDQYFDVNSPNLTLVVNKMRQLWITVLCLAPPFLFLRPDLKLRQLSLGKLLAFRLD